MILLTTLGLVLIFLLLAVFESLVYWLLLTIVIVLSTQAIFTLFWMLYAWNNPERSEELRSPHEFQPPKLSFTAIIPARHEETVIADTIRSVNKINYPSELKQILVVLRKDDTGTIEKAKETLYQLQNNKIKLIIFDGDPINKPHGLNQAFNFAYNEVIGIFDAEDEPHPDIYNIVNSVMLKNKCDVVQSGVQLMNFQTSWFSTLNVLEYYFWFKSGLAFFTHIGHVTPLGGNTVFFNRYMLRAIKGWDENCLTEDADIGIRLLIAGAKICVVYDEKHVTQEETPSTVNGFIKQRTRWVQGFLQVILKMDWLKLTGIRRKLFAVYLLSSSTVQTLLMVIAPIIALFSIMHNISLLASLLSFIPLYLLLLQVVIQTIGLYEFCKSYGLKFPLTSPIKIALTYYPYQMVIAWASLRAIHRQFIGEERWEKTDHNNLHRALI